MTTTNNDDTRMLTLADLLAAEIRTAMDDFETLEAEAPPVDVEMAAGDAIMARSEALVSEMLALKPATFLGFVAQEMAARWANGEAFGVVPADA
ncbi:MAG: hypothetical protein Devi2KO_39750 [Devosia indica]